MNQEEINDYNRRCAEFLGWEEEKGSWYKTDSSARFVIYSEHNNHPYRGLPFYRDWNWIMEVIEAIEKLKLGDVKIPVTFSSMHQGVRHEIEEYYNASVVFRIEYSDCRVDIVGTMRLRNDFIVVDNLLTKKEAVVQAINQFLIWYEQNKTI